MGWQEILVYILLGLIVFQIIFMLFVAPFFRKKRNDKIAKAQENLIRTIKIGHEVLLSSGIYGKVTKIEEFTFMIELSPNNVVKVNKDAILGFFDAKVAKKLKSKEGK